MLELKNGYGTDLSTKQLKFDNVVTLSYDVMTSTKIHLSGNIGRIHFRAKKLLKQKLYDGKKERSSVYCLLHWLFKNNYDKWAKHEVPFTY